jgi:hypothetical protein
LHMVVVPSSEWQHDDAGLVIVSDRQSRRGERRPDSI